ncbi:hypothetical protein H257_12606 [Aphanomyces astaci]|uniref:Beta-lactamase-related domain-containing protein n=1 Tax=Aphanomyces astaci TaxID=112090 RepID=W4FYE4_APHAT|nr:hypothetical protein H257_12606 [Aphanomyces astaci]ETV72507.1 hypothetical protein H257_12606 [Aphanomyces astaci]|eukprot:XP_009838189.1 hypothetical protein H257_12606 [Aphanomyces astaci]
MSDTVFQIGSYATTFIAMRIAKRADDGRIEWSDTVKNAAEVHTTLADLLTMNSGLGAYDGDMPFMLGMFKTEREITQRLFD